MNEKLTIRESIVCRILLLVAKILSRNMSDEVKKDINDLDSRLYVATV